MAGSKSTQTRDNRIYYTSLCLLFSTIMHRLMSTCLLSVVCGRYSGYSLYSCHNGSSLSVLIQSHYFCTPQNASIGMYSRYDYLLFVHVLILPSLHPSILFNCFYTKTQSCFCSFFIVLSVIYQCHLLSSVIKWKLKVPFNYVGGYIPKLPQKR